MAFVRIAIDTLREILLRFQLPGAARMNLSRRFPTAVLLLTPLLALHAVPAAAKPRPNIVLLLADDLGSGDVGCYGATKIKTPNIDRLAAEGVRLTDAHSPAAVCQPTRYAILSGTYFLRAQRQGQWTLYFHEGQVTLPGLLQAAGYRTAAIGKWHLGFGRGAEPDYNGELKPGPLEIGFDYFFGCPRTHNEPPFVFVENHRLVGLDAADPIRIIPHDEVVRRGLKDWNWGASEGAARAHAARPVDQIDLILADKALEFIKQKSDAPFFLYLPFLAPHVPIAPHAAFQGTSQAGRYGDFIQQLDACVGKVLDALQAQGLADNTLVIFTSDNGAVLQREALQAGHRPNGDLLGQKTDAWEGGHRVPFLARWPGRIPAGSQAGQLLGLTDLMATLAAAAEVTVPPDAAPDSLNQLPVLTDPAGAPAVRSEFLVQGTGGFALRQGEWMYLPQQGSCGMTVQVPPAAPWGQPYDKLGLVNSDVDETGRVKADAPAVQLYNLTADPGQRTNVAAREPGRAAAMQQRLSELTARPKPAAQPKPAAKSKVPGKVSAKPQPQEKPSYVFSFFRDNGQAGVYLALSDDGLSWREVNSGRPVLVPQVGGKLTRDPSICRGPDGQYHMVWTTSWTDKGFGVAHSKNLLDWSPQQFIEVNADEPKARNTWAPEIFYDDASQQYVVIWSTTIEGLFPETQVQGDGGHNHRIYATTTRDFTSWSPKQLFYNGGFNVIDAFLFRRDGRYGLIVKDETVQPVAEKNLHVVWSEAGVLGPWGQAGPAFTDNREAWAEGPAVIRVGDRWLVYFDKYNKGGYGAVETQDFVTFAPVPVSLPKGIRHGTIIEVDAETARGLAAE